MTKTNWSVPFTEMIAVMLWQTHELRKYARWQNAVFPSVKAGWLTQEPLCFKQSTFSEYHMRVINNVTRLWRFSNWCRRFQSFMSRGWELLKNRLVLHLQVQAAFYGTSHPRTQCNFPDDLYLNHVICISTPVHLNISFRGSDRPYGPRPPLWDSSITFKTHHTRYDISGRMISPTQRSLSDNTAFTRDKHPCTQQDSNPQSQQARSRKTHALDRAATGIGTSEYSYAVLTSQNSTVIKK